MINAQIEAIFKYDAEQVIHAISTQLGIPLTYNMSSVIWIDKYIDRNRETFLEENVAELIQLFGAFLGECIRHEYGGDWVERNNEWGIAFNNKHMISPFHAIQNHLDETPADSITSLVQGIPVWVTSNGMRLSA